MNKKVAQLTCYKGFFKAGKISGKGGFPIPVFPDMGSISTYPKKLKVLVEEMAKILKTWKPDLIASPDLRGVPYGTAVSLYTGVPFLMVRKEAKGCQLNKLIEGDFKKGQRVVIIDDAITTNQTKKESIRILRKHGLNVTGIIIFFNPWGDKTYTKKRKMSLQWLKDYKVKFEYLLSWEDCIKMWMEKGLVSKEFGQITIDFVKDPVNWGKKKENWQRFKKIAKDEKNLVFHKSFKEI